MIKKLVSLMMLLFLGLFTLFGCGEIGEIPDEESGGAPPVEGIEEIPDEGIGGTPSDEESGEMPTEAKGEFYDLWEAYYEYGWLNESDIKSIAYYHNGGREGNEAVMSEDYTPQPKTPEVLDDETDLTIRQDYWIDRFGKNNPDNITLAEIDYAYYGCYNNCIVVKMECKSCLVGDSYGESTIGGVKIIYRTNLRLSVWKLKGETPDEMPTEARGEFYELWEAYEYGWLNESDIKSVAYYFNGGREGNETVMSEDYMPQPKPKY